MWGRRKSAFDEAIAELKSDIKREKDSRRVFVSTSKMVVKRYRLMIRQLRTREAIERLIVPKKIPVYHVPSAYTIKVNAR